MIQRTIHHFEDEPELLQWIPGVLLNRYWAEHPDWIIDEGNFIEDDQGLVTTFQLAVRRQPCEIVYRQYPTIEEFDERFLKFARRDDVALIDLMGSVDVNVRQPVGLRAYRTAVDILGAERVFFLTAFPRELTTLANDARVIAKPVDASELASLLIALLDLT